MRVIWSMLLESPYDISKEIKVEYTDTEIYKKRCL